MTVRKQRREADRQPAPSGAARWVLRLPVALYSARAGWLLGHRFLLLEHRGRRTGRVYRTVLEVLSWDPVAREAVVMSGFGHKSQWYRNVLADGAAEVQIARLRFTATVRSVDADEAARLFA